MFNLDRRGALLSAGAGLAVGLASAWILWNEAPPKRQVDRDTVPPPMAVKVQGVERAPGPTPEPASPVLAATSEHQTATGESGATGQPAAAATDQAPAAVLPVELLDFSDAREKDGRLVQDLGEGRQVEYSVDLALQERARQIMEKAEVPFGAVVAMDPSTGRVLAYVSHSSARPELQHLPGLANPPAASIFKVITAAALIEEAAISPELETCYHGGSRGVRLKHLKDTDADTTCRTLGEALGRSSNVIFSKLADRNLTPESLGRYARAFGWNRELPFVFPLQTSRASFSDDRLTFAQTAAGFYHTHMSPMHGALVAATVANRGVMVAPQIVENYKVDGEVMQALETRPLGRAVTERTARRLATMMVNTTETGTAGPYFRNRDKSLKGIEVAGKTGTLSARTKDGTRHRFSWWVGFAPADNPRIAVSAMVVNIGGWRIKSSYLAREVLETWFATHDTAQGGETLSRR